ncbi:ATP-binding cassette domain-containing protein [Rhodocyclus tenuis]|uniref:ATP-binding cassette domain-containing protein n=1 Tax=Rhodocyclus gracilis TaxID=2929842 RepID=A0ABX0WIN1_9RHOO|nr:ATP-binding cassette domain-containing protein [Rhodocyclus gracilis]MRD72338.1 ATP-binding cassette domain-containing protein [Rhodocyclus gracilis]NJA89576.1 ATP-binding cassette domain-containing protein [Rhodocyclus gracilis]
MITASAVCKRYAEGREALKDVSFDIADGDFAYITGRSGAGKTTLFRLFAAIERPSSGGIVVNGQNLAALGRKAVPYLRRNIGLVFQDQKLLFDRNALANVLLPLSIVGLPAREAERRALAALDKVGLLDRAKAMPVALSGGEQQRLAIARAVVNRPSLLLADEPTANLDADSATDILGIFRAFHQVGVTVVVATHDPQALADVKPRVLRLDSGRLLSDGPLGAAPPSAGGLATGGAAR